MMLAKARLLVGIAVAFAAVALWGGSMASAGATTSSSPGCTSAGTVQISNVDFKVVGGDIVITFNHTATGTPTLLHVHENLVPTPHAGSDPVHQLSQDFCIGPNGPSSVSVPLLASADNKCFVQVDAHFNGDTAHAFFPTATCPSPTNTTTAPPTSSSAPSSAPATTTTAPSAPTTAPTTSTAPAVVPTSPSQSVLPSVAIETGQQLQPKASKWPLWSLGAIALLLISAGAFSLLAHRRRHGPAK